jgi:putative ABC transport system permease protein
MGNRRIRRPGAELGAPPVEVEVDEELAFHLAMQTRRFVAAGMAEDAARAAAERRFGDVDRVRDECRAIGHHMEDEMRRVEWRDELRQDITFAWRTLRRSPAFTVIALITLALGIGANTAIFSVVHRVLLEPLPYPTSDRLVLLWNQPAGADSRPNAVAPPEFADIAEQSQVFDGVAALSMQAVSLTGGCGSGTCEPERARAYRVSPNLFQLLGVSPSRGRDFAAGDGLQGAEPVVMLSHALWQRRFGGDAELVGRTIMLNGQLRTVVGIMPPDVRFPDVPLDFLNEPADVWLPFTWQQARGEGRGNQYLGVVARLRPGVTPASVRADLDLIASRFRAAFPDRYSTAKWSRIMSISLRDQMVGEVRPALVVLTVAVGLVLLIACVNVANLLLARGAARHKELAVRLALGAGRWRIARQLITESLLLALAGGIVGALLALWGVRLLVRLADSRLPGIAEVHVDAVTLAYTLGLALLTGVLFGLAPVVQQWGADVRDGLGSTARGSSAGKGHARLRSALVIAEVAMALVLLVGAGLLLRSFGELQRVRPGFDPAGVVTFRLSLPPLTYDSDAKRAAFHRDLIAHIASLPGVAQVGEVYPLPMSGDGWSGSFFVEGQAVAPGAPTPHAEYAVSTPGYFRSMGVPLRAGRDFSFQDEASTPPVAVVDEVLASRYWPGESALGKRVGQNEGQWATVVGVVAHVHNAGPQEEGEPQLYFPFLQSTQAPMYGVVRAVDAAGASSLLPSICQQVRALDADLPVGRLQPMSELVDSSVARQRFNALLLGIFGTVALVLAAVGLYGVMSFLVAQRSQEIGIRLALGSRPADVLRLVLRQGLVITAAGLVAGIAGAIALSRLAATLLFGVQPTDPTTYAGVALLLTAVAVVACVLPARRATRIDPVHAMRGE